MYSLYQQRSFGEKFDVVFAWVRENWKTLLALQAVFFIPLAIVQAIGQTAVFSSGMKYASVADVPTSYGATVVLYYVCAIVGAFLSMAVNMAVIKHCFIDKGVPSDLTPALLWNKAKSLMPRLLLSYVFLAVAFTVIAVVAALLVLVSGLTLLLTVPVIVWLAFAVLPFLPIYLFTDEPIMEALAHSLRLGKKCWGGFFATYFCVTILVQLVALVFAIPFYLFFVLGNVLSGNFLLQTCLYLSGVLLVFATYCLQIVTFLMISVQYGHAAVKVDGVTAD